MRDIETEKMVRQKVLEETDYCCAYCGEARGRIGAGVEVHHINGRDNITRFDPRGQIPLCDEDHKWNKDSPHKDPRAFLKWLRKNWPAKYRFYIRNRYRIVQNRDVDLKKIRRKLRAA